MANDAFPRGTYAKYKRATTFFLHWLERAHNSGVGGGGGVTSSDSAKQKLDVYAGIADAIAAAPTALPPVLLRAYPHALEACESAITLRTRVAVFLGDAADDAHAHFLARMMAWFQLLKDAYLATPSNEKKTEKTMDFSNYYDVLALPDDYFTGDTTDEQDETISVPALILPAILSKGDRKRLQESAFEGDFYTEMACVFMELDELSEAVYAAFLDVKREHKTLLEAAVLTKVAIDSAASVLANFQLRHPSINDAIDFARLVRDRMSLEQITRLVSTVKLAWKPSDATAKGDRYQYVPGTVLVDLVGVTDVLAAFAGRFTSHSNDRFDGGDPILSVPAYDEERSQDAVTPEWSVKSKFFMSCLPRLFNTLTDIRDCGASMLPSSLEAWFLGPFEQLKKTGKVSSHLVFSCVCWTRSVAALQGNQDLARTISASFMHMWDVQERITASMVRNGGRGALHGEKQKVHNKIEIASFVATHMRTNPLLAGCVMLDHQMRFLSLGSNALLLSLLRAFSHIYSALRDRQLLDEIPFLEDTIRVYEESVFTPSRAAATHGSFARSFLASHNLMETTVSLRYGMETSSRPGHTRSLVEKGRLVNLSGIMRLIEKKDFSVLPPASSTSWKSLLSSVSDLCRAELFTSRVLSRDGLRLSDDLSDLCNRLCDELGRRPHYERMVADSKIPARALENAIVFPLLPLLDSLQDQDVVHLVPVSENRMNGDALLEAVADRSTRSRLAFCRRAASIIAHHFEQSSWVERNYFTLPPTPAWVSTEYGRLQSDAASPSDAFVREEFNALMEMLGTSQGPLRGDLLDDFKRRVVATPAVVGTMSTDPTLELCSLFHLAAAGTAHDNNLVEWLIQMGALRLEPRHCRDRAIGEAAESLKGLCNALAIHAAAERGLKKIVQHIVAAGNFRDVDTRTYHTKESLVQLAVKAGNRPLWAWLCLFDADNRGTDASGKHIWDVTTNREWKRNLKERVEVEEYKRSRRNPKALDVLKADLENTPDGLRALASAEEVMQRYSERRSGGVSAVTGSEPASPSATDLTSTGAATKEKHTGSKKKKKKAKTKAPAASLDTDSTVTASSRNLGHLFDASTQDRVGAQVQTLSATLEQLRHDQFVSHDEREACAVRVVATFEKFANSANDIVMVGIMSESAAVKREVEAMGYVALLLGEYAQHLNEQGTSADDQDDESQLAMLHAIFTPAVDERFYYYHLFLLKCSTLLRVFHMTAREQAVLLLMERLLLSIPDRTRAFRQMVEEYTSSRSIGNPNASIASTPSVQRQLEWYTSTRGIDDPLELDRLDRLGGCSHFFCLHIVGGLGNPLLAPTKSLIDDTIPHGRDAVFVTDCIIAGAQTKLHLHEILQVVLDAATQTGLELQYDEAANVDIPSVQILGFAFSARGIVRCVE